MNHHAPTHPPTPGPEPAVASHPDLDAGHVWEVPAEDAHSRSRAVHVGIRDGRVVQLVPPGNAAVMTAPQTRAVIAALSRAVHVIERDNPDLYRPGAPAAGLAVKRVYRNTSLGALPTIPSNSDQPSGRG